MDTWGISGPAFLGIYGAALALAGLAAFATIRWIRGASDRSGLTGVQAPELSPSEVAMLKEGDSLVLTVATCRLKDEHSLKLDDDGTGLVVALAELVEDRPAGGIRESLEHVVHGPRKIGK